MKNRAFFKEDAYLWTKTDLKQITERQWIA